MSDREDIKQDAHYEKMREKNEREYLVHIKVVAEVYVRADKNASDDDLLELASDKFDYHDITDYEFVEAEDWT